MNKCCMELFELMISKFQEEIREKLTWDVELCFKGRILTKRVYRLGKFSIDEYLRPKRTPKVFFGKVNISAEFFIESNNVEKIKEKIKNEIIGTLEPRYSEIDKSPRRRLIMSNDIILKPCPFCGSKDIELSAEEYHDKDVFYIVSCNNCGAQIEGSGRGKEAAEAWNTRKEEAFADKEIDFIKKPYRWQFSIVKLIHRNPQMKNKSDVEY